MLAAHMMRASATQHRVCAVGGNHQIEGTMHVALRVVQRLRGGIVVFNPDTCKDASRSRSCLLQGIEQRIARRNAEA